MRTEKVLKVLRRSLQAIALAVVALILITNLYRIAAREIFKVKAPTVFGYSSAVVLTGSMSGAIEPNDLIVTHKQNEYEVGDIITYQTGGTPVTHRIVAVHDNGYLTKGDANNTDDGADIQKEYVIGKVVLIIPKIGSAVSFIKTPLGMLILMGALALIIELPYITKRIKERKSR